MLSGQKLKIAEFLGMNLAHNVVAETLGVHPSYITNLLKTDEEVRDFVYKKKLETVTKGSTLDNLYDSLEESVLKKLKDSMIFVTDPMKLTRILQTLNQAKRRNTGLHQEVLQKPVATVVLPVIISQRFIMNSSNQAIQVGEQTLVTIPSSNVVGLLETQTIDQSLLGPPERYKHENIRD